MIPLPSPDFISLLTTMTARNGRLMSLDVEAVLAIGIAGFSAILLSPPDNPMVQSTHLCHLMSAERSICPRAEGFI